MNKLNKISTEIITYVSNRSIRIQGGRHQIIIQREINKASIYFATFLFQNMLFYYFP